MSRRKAPTIDPDPREAKLPVWAKDTIDLLRQKLAEEKKRNAHLQRSLVDQTPDDTAPIVASAWQLGDVPLPANTRLRLHRPGGTDRLEAIEAYIDATTGDLTLMANSGYLLVKPKSSNVIALDGRYPRR